MKNTEDRRITRSKAMIRKGLFELLEEKPLSQITIIELTNRAGINRKTFYNHYRSIYDVIDEIEGECIERYKVIFSKENVYEYIDDTSRLFEKLLSEITQNEELYRLMTHSDMHLHFTGRLTSDIKGWLKGFTVKKDSLNMELMEYYYDFVAAGVVDVIYRWLTNDNDVSPETLAGFFNAIAKTSEARKYFKKED